MKMDDNLRWLLDQLPPEQELRERIEHLDKEIREMGRQQAALQVALQARQLATAAASPDRIAEALMVAANSDQTVNGMVRPSISRAIKILVEEAPGRTLTARELMAALKERGWLPAAKDPRKAVGATLSRMVHRTNELEHLGRATYRLREHSNGSSAPREEDEPEGTASNRLFIGPADGKAESEDV